VASSGRQASNGKLASWPNRVDRRSVARCCDRVRQFCSSHENPWTGSFGRVIRDRDAPYRRTRSGYFPLYGAILDSPRLRVAVSARAEICGQCRKEKSLDDFHRRGENGRQPICKTCRSGQDSTRRDVCECGRPKPLATRIVPSVVTTYLTRDVRLRMQKWPGSPASWKVKGAGLGPATGSLGGSPSG
jgi:hypothetical protein